MDGRVAANLSISAEMKSYWPRACYSWKHKFHFVPQIALVSNLFYSVIFGWPTASFRCLSLCFNGLLGEIWDAAGTTPVACMLVEAALFYVSWHWPPEAWAQRHQRWFGVGSSVSLTGLWRFTDLPQTHQLNAAPESQGSTQPLVLACSPATLKSLKWATWLFRALSCKRLLIVSVTETKRGEPPLLRWARVFGGRVRKKKSPFSWERQVPFSFIKKKYIYFL